MDAAEITEYNREIHPGSVAIVGVPSVGNVGLILSEYISRTLNTTTVTGIDSPEIPICTIIDKGVPYPPIRIFMETHDSPDRDFRVAALISAAPIDYNNCRLTAAAIAEALQKLGVSRVISVNGVPKSNVKLKVCCGNLPVSPQIAKKHGLAIIGDGIIKGFPGLLIREGRKRGMQIMDIAYPANDSAPDPIAAAEAGSIIADILSIPLDFNKLYGEAENIKNARAKNGDDLSTRGLYG